MSKQEKQQHNKPQTIKGNIKEAVEAIERRRRHLEHLKRQDHPISEDAAKILEFAEKNKHKNNTKRG